MDRLEVRLQKIAKRYDRDWIIRDLDGQFSSDHCYGIRGRNGSGKSTLLRLLAGHLSPTRGKVSYSYGDRQLTPAQLFPLLSYVAPYVDPIEELTLTEALRFHFRLKPLQPGLSLDELPALLELEKARNRPIQAFSSGMKQRLMLGFALFSATPFVILDEPTTTLDAPAQAWFQAQLTRFRAGRLIVIATNVESDLEQCDRIFDLRDSSLL